MRSCLKLLDRFRPASPAPLSPGRRRALPSGATTTRSCRCACWRTTVVPGGRCGRRPACTGHRRGRQVHPLGPAGGQDERIAVDSPYAQAKSVLLGTVAVANRCQAVRSVKFGFSNVFGAADDLAAVELLYTSLLAQATTAMLAAGSADRRRRLPSFRESFLAAYAVRVGERLRGAADAAVGDGVTRHGDRLLPVLARRSDAVDAAVAAAFPQTSRSPLRAPNHAGWAAGLAAAELARLGPDHALDNGAPTSGPISTSEAEQLHLAV